MRPITIKRNRALTLVEFAMVLLIMTLLFSTIRPAYLHLVNEAKAEQTQDKIEQISTKINEYFENNGTLPDSLDQVFSPVPLDPWGNPYQYLRIDGGAPTAQGQQRKDKNLVPINSDYDLYSMGPDGKSVPPLTGNASRDDIVRGRDGDYFGPATEY